MEFITNAPKFLMTFDRQIQSTPMKKILLTLTVGAFLSAATAQDITSNLEAYVSFDAGNAAIDAGSATVAGVVNGATSVDDRNGNPNSAMYFDAGDWIDFGNYSNYQFGFDSFTITCWVKGDGSTSAAGYVIGKRGFTASQDHVYAITYNYNGGGQVFGYIRDDNSQAITSYPTADCQADEWHHVALVVDRSTNFAGFYVDGLPVSASPLGNGFASLDANGTSFGNLVMGRSSNGDQYFKGWIDELRIYRRALTQADLALLQDPVPIDLTSNLQIDLPFCDGLVTDETGNHDMSLVFDGTFPTTDRNGTADAARAFTTGSQSYMNIPANLISTTDFTISVWYYYTGAGGYPRLVDMSKQQNSTSDAIILYPSTLGNNIPFFGMWNSSSSQQVQLTAQASDASINEWTHLVVTKSGNAYTMYVNGQVSSAISSSFVPANVNRVVSRLGRSAYSSPAELFPGMIDDFKVWQRGLTVQEVVALYNETDPCVSVPPCDVNIPDAVLKSILLNNASINTNQDTEIQCSEAAAFTGFIDLSNSAVTDLTGLEAFTAASQLSISGSSATNFDISANTALTYFDCSVLGLTGSLSFSAANSALRNVFVDGNQLSGVDMSALINLEHLDCSFNSISSLDLSNNPALRILAADGNQLSALDLSNNPQLTDLSVSSNGIVSLDVSGNGSLVTINVQGNVPMVYLNVANGNNTNFTFYNSFNNPNLGCIQVDDVAYSVANWTNVHPFSTFSTFCATVGVDETALTELELFPNPTSGLLFISEPISGQVMDVAGKVVLGFNNARTIDLGVLQTGIYMLRTEGGSVHRVVRQ
ncbi:MAG: hypothetical protein EP314_03240 [Bacteroidetes bacterium]|nr:MAG: hypothetical protein EP314_03240 [Bacteroidota bacterium]